MGWLRDFMASAQPPITSFGRLAALCLDHEAWPAGLSPKQRSLSTLFSKLDRGKDLDWLRDRVEVQQVLADLFKRSLGDLRSALGEVPTEEGARFVRLVDVRYARELDLSQDDLPPGIPSEAYTPQLWAPTWWTAPAGSGRSLVAAWLKTRGFAHSTTISNRDDLTRVPTRGALFVELEAGFDAQSIALTEADLVALRAAHRPICIAAPFPPPAALPFEELQSPPVSDYLPELIDWIDERLDGTGNFHPDRVENWMRKVALPAGAVTSFGDALGLLGMADETHPRSLLAKSLDELAEHYVKRRVREASEHMSVGPRLADSAFAALQECAARVLVSGANTLLQPHPLDEWTALLATPGDDESPDPEWFTQALKGALGSQVSRQDLRRAAKKLPPSAFQLTKSLESAGLLVRVPGTSDREESGAERLLHPRWLVTLLSARATQESLRLAPSQWGRVLLSGRDPDAVIRALVESGEHDDFKSSFAVADDFDSAQPEWVAALEGAIVAVGISALGGREIPEELCEALLQLAAEDFLVLENLPEPRLTRRNAKLFNRNVYLTSLVALCQTAPFPLKHLDPLRSRSRELGAHFQSALLATLKTLSPESISPVGIIRVLDALSLENNTSRAKCLQLLDTVQSASATLLDEALEEAKLEHLLAYVDSSERSSHSFTQGLWKILVAHPSPSSLFESRERCRDFWRQAPGPVLVERARQNLPIDWAALLPHQYAEWFSQSDAPGLPEDAGRNCPIDAALSQCETSGATSIPSATLRAILARGAARFAPLILTYLEEDAPDQARHVLASTPPEASASLARALPPAAQLLELRAPGLNTLRAFLLRACQERHPEFEDCYVRLMDLENGLRPLRNLG